MQVKKEMTCAHSRVLLWKDQGLLYQQAATTSTSNYNYSYKFFHSRVLLWKGQGLLYQQAATTSTSSYNYSYNFFGEPAPSAFNLRGTCQ
jgi:hypothetical protein